MVIQSKNKSNQEKEEKILMMTKFKYNSAKSPKPNFKNLKKLNWESTQKLKTKVLKKM